MYGKLIAAVVTVLAIASGAYFYIERGQVPGNPGVVCTQEAMLCPDGSAVGRTGPNCEFAACPGEMPGTVPPSTRASDAHEWTFEQSELTIDNTSATRVFIDGTFVGAYDGSCHTIAGTNWTLLPGESSGVICWYGGGGKEIGLFGNNVRVGDLDEGSAEDPGTRGNFKTVLTLPDANNGPNGVTDCDVPQKPSTSCRVGTLEFVPSGGALSGGICAGSWQCVQGL